MIGRNIISLITKIMDLLTEEKRMEFNKAKSMYFLYGALIFTAVLGIVCGIGLLFPNQIFGYYLFFIVSGMMIYSYISYVGKTHENKNWIMFVVSILVIILIIILVTILGIYMASGVID
jgi:4-hydroxybenzoate polyprenyltransferase